MKMHVKRSSLENFFLFHTNRPNIFPDLPRLENNQTFSILQGFVETRD